MDDLIQLVRTYRFEKSLDQKLRIAEQVLRLIEPKLRLFCASSIADRTKAADTAQEVLIAIARDMGRFQGKATAEFWAWCYQIARHKIKDHFRRQGVQDDRFQPMDPGEIAQLLDGRTRRGAISAQDKMDLDYAVKVLRRAEPECLEFLWKHFVFGFGFVEMAQEFAITADAARMRVGRCLSAAQALIT